MLNASEIMNHVCQKRMTVFDNEIEFKSLMPSTIKRPPWELVLLFLEVEVLSVE